MHPEEKRLQQALLDACQRIDAATNARQCALVIEALTALTNLRAWQAGEMVALAYLEGKRASDVAGVDASVPQSATLPPKGELN